MDKNDLLKEIETLLVNGQLSRGEILTTCDRSLKATSQDKAQKQSKISTILYYIGGAIIYLGISIFIATNWSALSDATRIISTLGSALMMYLSAVLISPYKDLRKITDAFFFVFALTVPLGIFITLDIAGIKTDTAGIHALIAGLLMLTHVVSYLIFRNNVFYVFGVICGTWLFFSFTTFFIGGRPFSNWEFIKYRWLAVGLTHMIMGYALAETQRKGLTPALYGFGVIEFLSAAMALGGWSPSQNILWELLFPGFCFGAIFISVYLKSRTFLIFGTIFLMSFLFKITAQYFTSGFGWALSLVVLGFTLIGIGYFAFQLNTRYLSR